MTEALSPPLFSILSSLVEDRFGIVYLPSDATVFAERVMGRAVEAGFESPLDYYYFLRYDQRAEEELVRLVDALVVGETYFFRELTALDAAIEVAIRPAIERHGRARVWSAACAGGEEPLTLAMLLEPLGLLDRTTILATDISTKALARARAGVYGGRAMRMVEPPGRHPRLDALATRFFERGPKGFVVDPALQRRIELKQLNLVDGAAIEKLGQFDLVLCRNVLIYFAEDTTRAVVDSLGARLVADGKLAVGASESLLRFGTQLVCRETGGAFLYGRAR